MPLVLPVQSEVDMKLTVVQRCCRLFSRPRFLSRERPLVGTYASYLIPHQGPLVPLSLIFPLLYSALFGHYWRLLVFALQLISVDHCF